MLGLTFTDEVYVANNATEVNLKPNGHNIEVTEANKDEYLLLLARFRLQSGIEAQMKDFRRGFARYYDCTTNMLVDWY
jgi:hypothetical protein